MTDTVANPNSRRIIKVRDRNRRMCSDTLNRQAGTQTTSTKQAFRERETQAGSRGKESDRHVCTTHGQTDRQRRFRVVKSSLDTGSDSMATAAARATAPPIEWPTRTIGMLRCLAIYSFLSQVMHATA